MEQGAGGEGSTAAPGALRSETSAVPSGADAEYHRGPGPFAEVRARVPTVAEGPMEDAASAPSSTTTIAPSSSANSRRPRSLSGAPASRAALLAARRAARSLPLQLPSSAMSDVAPSASPSQGATTRRAPAASARGRAWRGTASEPISAANAFDDRGRSAGRPQRSIYRDQPRTVRPSCVRPTWTITLCTLRPRRCAHAWGMVLFGRAGRGHLIAVPALVARPHHRRPGCRLWRRAEDADDRVAAHEARLPASTSSGPGLLRSRRVWPIFPMFVRLHRPRDHLALVGQKPEPRAASARELRRVRRGAVQAPARAQRAPCQHAAVLQPGPRTGELLLGRVRQQWGDIPSPTSLWAASSRIPRGRRGGQRESQVAAASSAQHQRRARRVAGSRLRGQEAKLYVAAEPVGLDRGLSTTSAASEDRRYQQRVTGRVAVAIVLRWRPWRPSRAASAGVLLPPGWSARARSSTTRAQPGQRVGQRILTRTPQHLQFWERQRVGATAGAIARPQQHHGQRVDHMEVVEDEDASASEVRPREDEDPRERTPRRVDADSGRQAA